MLITSELFNHYFTEIEFEYNQDNQRVCMQAFAETLSESDFFTLPDLLDSVIQSLNVYGAEGMPESITNRLPNDSIDLSVLDEVITIDEYAEVYHKEMYFIGGGDDPLLLGGMVIRHRATLTLPYDGWRIQELRHLMQARPTSFIEMPQVESLIPPHILSLPEYVVSGADASVVCNGTG